MSYGRQAPFGRTDEAEDANDFHGEMAPPESPGVFERSDLAGLVFHISECSREMATGQPINRSSREFWPADRHAHLDSDDTGRICGDLFSVESAGSVSCAWRHGRPARARD